MFNRVGFVSRIHGLNLNRLRYFTLGKKFRSLKTFADGCDIFLNLYFINIEIQGRTDDKRKAY